MKPSRLLALATCAFAFWATSCPAAGESISVNVTQDGSYAISGSEGNSGYESVANANWTDISISRGTINVSGLKLNDGSSTPVTMTASSGGSWSYDSTGAFGSMGRGYADGDWTIQLANIPFSSYEVILYMATDWSARWGAVGVQLATEEAPTYYAYPLVDIDSVTPLTDDAIYAVTSVTTDDGTSAITATSTWGKSRPSTHGYGVDVMRIGSLSGSNITITTKGDNGASGNAYSTAIRSGLYGFQIVNTGDLITGSTFTASPSGTDVTFGDITWNEEGGLVQGAANSTEVTLAAGATLRVTEEVTLRTLKVISTGDVTIVGTEAALAKVLKIDATEVTGTATLAYSNTSATPAIPLLPGVDVFKKHGTAAFAPTSNAPFAGVQIIAEAGTSTFNLNLTGMKATAEKPFTVTGEDTVANFQGSNYNKAPAGGTLKATNGATLGITGTNPFDSSNPVAILVDSANLAVTHGSGNHVKAGMVTLSNGSAITIAGTANAWTSEGFVLLGTDNKLVAESGENTVTYGETDTARNRLRIQSGIIEVKDGATLTVGVELASGSGEGTTGANSTITKTGAGLLKLTDAATPGTVNASEGTLDIGGHRPTIATLGESAKLVVAPTATELATGSITLNITTGTLSESNVTVTGATINAVSGSTITFTMTVPELKTSGAWSTASWSTSSLPTSAAKLIGGATPEAAITVTLDTDLSTLSTLVISGYVTLVTTEVQATIPACVALDSGATLTVSAPFSGPLTVQTGTTVKMNGITMASALTVNGTLKTSGTTSLTGGNTVAEGATVEVLDGTTTFGLSGSEAFKGTLKVASGATFKNGTADGPDYDGKAQFEIYGTLEVMGQTRWSLNTGTGLHLYDGAELKGEGDTQYGAAFDFYNGGKVITEGTVAINAPFAVHNGSGKALEIETAAGSVVTMTKAISPTLGANSTGTVNFKKSGKGTLTMTANSTLVGTNTVADGKLILSSANGGSSASWVIDPGATLESTGSFTVPFSKGAGVKITNNGTLRVASVDGQIPPTEGSGDVVIGANCRLAGPLTTTGTLTVPSGYTLDLSRAKNDANVEDTFDGTPSINGPSVVCAGSITSETVTIASGKTLSGTGTIGSALTFANGAVLDVTDVTDDALTATGTVTIAESGNVTVTGATASTTTILTCPSPETLLAQFTGAPEGYLFAANEGKTAVVLVAKPTVEIPKVPGESGDKVELSANSKSVLQTVAEANRLTSVTAVSGSTTVNGIPTPLKAEAIDNALAVFGERVVTVDGTELKVDYNFGIVAIEPSAYFFTVKAKAERVAGATTTAMALVSGATLELVEADTETVINDVFDGFTYDAGTGLYTAYFTTDATHADRLIGRSFKVRAKKE